MLKKFFFFFSIALLTFGFSVGAATDSTNVGLEVTCPNNSCVKPTGGGGGVDPDPQPTAGCTDPLAENYNSAATSDDGSCTYSLRIPNVSDFSAIYDATDKQVVLSWVNPSDSNFAAVRIMGSAVFFPADQTSGRLIYEDSGQRTTDPLVSAGQTYFYAAFVRDANGDYSSGAVASVIIPDEPPPENEEPPPPDEGTTPPTDGDTGETGGGGQEISDPFDDFPEIEKVTDPLVINLEFGDFIFSQPGEPRQFFRNNGRVRINGQKILTIMIPYEKVPETLKIIGLTLKDPLDKRRSFSFLLRINPEKTAYQATLAPLERDGIYQMHISIINYQDQRIKRLTGELLVGALGGRTPGAAEKIFRAVASPVVISSGLIVGAAQGLSFAGSINSFYDLYLLFLKLFGLLAGVFRLKKKSAPWGVVYDAVTKRPLDPAYVIVREGENDQGTAITDLDGRYGFFLKPGRYTLTANKTHYEFPSKKLIGRMKDELYDNLYHGETLATAAGELINCNIPMDPVAFDWNEFTKNKQGFFILHSQKEKRRRMFLSSIRWLGFILAAWNTAVYPGLFNFSVLGLYLIIFAAGRWWHSRHRAVSIKNRATGLPIPFAIIKVFVPGVDQQVKSAVADELGRFFFLTPPGDYYLTVDEKQDDGSYRTIYRSETIKLARGVPEKDLLI